MKIKRGVILVGLDIRMRPALILADMVYKTRNRNLVITSGLEGTHSAGSMHYYGLAIDIRTYYFSADVKRKVYSVLKDRLGASYTVLHENNHIHIHYNL